MLSRILSIDQNNYPEMMGHTCIINAPVVFKAIWSFIRPMLDARTAGKIEVVSLTCCSSLSRRYLLHLPTVSNYLSLLA